MKLERRQVPAVQSYADRNATHFAAYNPFGRCKQAGVAKTIQVCHSTQAQFAPWMKAWHINLNIIRHMLQGSTQTNQSSDAVNVEPLAMKT